MNDGRLTERVGDRVQWSTLAIVLAVCMPVVTVAFGYGMLYEKVEGISMQEDSTAKLYSQMQTAISQLNVSVATLSVSVQSLSTEVAKSERQRNEGSNSPRP